MKLISMKKDSDDMGEAAYCMSAKYGYGLTLHLDEDQCESLGITKRLRLVLKSRYKRLLSLLQLLNH